MLRVDDDQKGVCRGSECPQRLPEPFIQMRHVERDEQWIWLFFAPKDPGDVHWLPGLDYTTVSETENLTSGRNQITFNVFCSDTVVLFLLLHKKHMHISI